MNILLIAPFAPPTNTAEAIQVRRVLVELDKHSCGTLVTLSSKQYGLRREAGLMLPLAHYDTLLLTLPFHHLTSRIRFPRVFASWLAPENVLWIKFKANYVLRSLKQKPDIIYSRSMPMSAALLASELQKKLGIPWIMHLSDPWADSFYKKPNLKNSLDERACFTQADMITLTTTGQVMYYRQKYPEHADKIFIFPNIMPGANYEPSTKHSSVNREERCLRLVYAGALYGSRSPESLLKALETLRAKMPDLLTRLRVDFYGNAPDKMRALFKTMPDVVHYHGRTSFQKAYEAQSSADVVLSIEPESENPLSRCFLPSKVVDCLFLRKPILAITPSGSETAKICEAGYGWACSPFQTEALAARIAYLIENVPILRQRAAPPPPLEYDPKAVVAGLLQHMHRLCAPASKATRKEE